MSFDVDLKALCEAYKERADSVVGNIVESIVGEIDWRSPIGDAVYWKSPAPKGYVGGRFRNNWQLGIGSVNYATNSGTDRSAKNKKTGGTTTHGIIASIPAEAAGKVFYVSNSLPYAQALEYGHSRQAPGPGGVLGLTVAMFQQIVRQAIEDAK